MQMDKSTHDLHMWIMINAAQAYKDKPKLRLDVSFNKFFICNPTH